MKKHLYMKHTVVCVTSFVVPLVYYASLLYNWTVFENSMNNV